MENHHRFWGVNPDTHTLEGAVPSAHTVTEFVFAPDTVEDGRYLLDLQVAPFASDAAPSRPVLYKLEDHD